MKRFTLAVSCLIALSSSAVATPATTEDSAENYPSKAIRFLVPYSAGGPTDAMARMLGEELTTAWGQPVVVENQPGASGIIATESLLRAPADGHTIILVTSSHVFLPAVTRNLSYDPVADFAPIGSVARAQFILLTNPKRASTTLKDVIEEAKSNPDKLNFGVVGIVGMGRVAFELFRARAGLELTRIPYQGSAPVLTALGGGEVDYSIDIGGAHIQNIKSGRIGALAVTGQKRLANLPNVPTFAEAGLPDYDINMWFGIFAKAGTPQGIIDKLSQQIATIAAKPAFQQRLAAQELEPMISTAAEFAETVRTDAQLYTDIVKKAGIKPE